ncbi:MAG: PBP1A family penicillin-binding protein [Thermoanaerobaculia bacterium]|nr:PBP1A family penicillin-binding protein [Thermoanaerobaculia bacterium]
MDSSPKPPLLQRLRAQLTRKRVLWTLGIGTGLVTLVVIWAVAPYWRAAGQFDEVPTLQPSRLYGQPVVLRRGQSIQLPKLLARLNAQGYRAALPGEPLVAGRYRQNAQGVTTIYTRFHPTRNGPGGGVPIEIRTDGRRITALAVQGAQVNLAELEPPVIASFYGDDFKERRPVKVGELPRDVVATILAAEDSHFFTHAGVSVSGIARALLVNLRGGEVRQGGSTLTQQLVKNLYLNHERSLSRKIREAVLAVVLELRYSKNEILQAYLNEIYLGSSGGVNLIGIGAASRALFGKDPTSLSLGEAAVIAGMIPSPANYSPLAHPDKALERRNRVLDRLVELEWVKPEVVTQAKAEPIRLSPDEPVRRRAPYFAVAAAAEAAERFAVTELDDAGYALLSTLDLDDQTEAEEAVTWGLGKLEKGWEKGRETAGPLQAALVSVDPEDGGIRAYVGGRDFGQSQFDRAGQARRQAGSAFKPVVYAAAFESRIASPATLVEDEPLTVTLHNQTWQPGNDDGEYLGWITVRQAVAGSRNVPTARIALQTGLGRIVETARDLGVTAPLEEVPALALGAFELSPVEMATIYATLANGGQRPAVHGLVAVNDATGKPIEGQPLAPTRRVLSAPATYLVTSVLQGVLDGGTAASAREQGLGDRLAGKTGTTNGRRDSWFAGYSPDRATVVWVGYDDNAESRMSGSRAALPIWTHFTLGVRPPGGYPEFRVPRGLVTATVDPTTGGLATENCPEAITEVFLEGEAPGQICHLHGGFWAEPVDAEPRRGEEEVGGFRRFFRKLFGRDRDKPRDPPRDPP